MWKWIAEFSEIFVFNMVFLSICDIKISGQLVEFAHLSNFVDLHKKPPYVIPQLIH